MRILFVLLLLSLSGSAQVSSRLEINKLTDDLYVYKTYGFFSGNAFPSNSMYLVTDEGVVLFDTPWDKGQFGPLLDSIKKRHNKEVVMCIATHFHDDRTAGFEYYEGKGIKTYSSKLTYDLCKKKNITPAQHFFVNDTTFTIGEKTFETFYPGKGHSPDNIVIWIKDEKVLYCGCFVKSTENSDLGNLSDANVNAWDDSIKKVMNKYPKPLYVIPGHFGWSKGNRDLKHTLKLVKEYKKE